MSNMIRKFGVASFKSHPHFALCELEADYVLFWQEFSADCLDPKVRAEAETMIKGWKGKGTLSSSQIEKLRRWATDKSLFLG